MVVILAVVDGSRHVDIVVGSSGRIEGGLVADGSSGQKVRPEEIFD